MRLTNLLPIMLLAATAAGCAADAEQPPSDRAARRAAIDNVYRAFTQAYATLDGAAMHAIYTDDCVYLPPGAGGALRDCREALAGFDRMFDAVRANGNRLDITFHFDDRSLADSLAHDVGVYRLVSVANDTDTLSVSYGRFVTVLKRQRDDRWRIHVDTYDPTDAAAFDEARPM